MGGIAFLFSGQGAQCAGMGMEFYHADSKIKAMFDAAEQLRTGTLQQLQSADAATLQQTENTQPCLYLADLAAAEYLRSRGLVPQAAAGFSLGELPALAFAGAYTAQDGFALVVKRGLYMGQAAQQCGAGMAAVVKLDNQTVEQLCSGFAHIYPVNYNSPGQLVVSGAKDELEAFGQAVVQAGGRVLPLRVSGGFHSPFMDSAAQQFAAALQTVTTAVPQIPVYANQTAQVYTAAPSLTLAQQINHPVLWEKTIRSMADSGIDTFIETGVGNVLQKLVGKILPQAKAYAVSTPAQADAVLQEVGVC